MTDMNAILLSYWHSPPCNTPGDLTSPRENCYLETAFWKEDQIEALKSRGSQLRSRCHLGRRY